MRVLFHPLRNRKDILRRTAMVLDRRLPGPEAPRTLVRVPDTAMRDELDRYLWIWRSDGFTAHGTSDGDKDRPERQPVYLALPLEDAPNQPKMVLWYGAIPQSQTEMREFLLFPEAELVFTEEPEIREAARKLWSDLVEAGIQPVSQQY